MTRLCNGLRLLRATILLLVVLWAAPVVAIDEADVQAFRERLQTQSNEWVSVTAGVPSRDESEQLFSRDLYKEGIQPVFLRIRNTLPETLHFLPVGLDPVYYTPLEVANFGANISGERLVNLEFLQIEMSMVIEPGSVREGFIFTKLDEGTKSFNVDVVNQNNFDTFTFFIPVPGLKIDHYEIDFPSLYEPSEGLETDDPEELARWVEAFQCCVTDKQGENTGDPLNLVLIGFPADVYTALIRAGWDETERVTKASLWKTVKSFFSGGEYRYSPVSNLFVLDRAQDVAMQKARDDIHERNHLRLWMTPVSFKGYPVWIGQISRDIGVRFTRKTITTHKIDPNVDETRNYLLEDLIYAQSLRHYGFLGGVGPVSRDAPRGNLTLDSGLWSDP